MARIGYARVSSAGQDYQLQIDRLAKDGCAPIRAEKVTGAAREGRGELGAILDFIREGDELVVVRLDRLARSTRDTLNIVAELEAKGASLRVLEPEISTGGDLGRIVITTLGMVAELERSFLRERQRAGIVAAKARGAYKGRRKSVDSAAIASLLAQGLGPTAIAKHLGISRMTVYRETGGMTSTAVKTTAG
ncbi:recombinase family protein [Brevundimonas halotolerans]|uniref:DNA invertase Pin-like site-specific DNA recombinase n=1 Tax=Brevundimonas halotolerans TaxID=69670 RepID=A0A7W9E8T4_9CAUL|nr:recombinase family protein [Brevundimonas halotolerans]MBB5661090.1 DNA invertase Pin-like site-specific DNA recombinase [Brevundimonas halotolerans]